MIKLSKCTIETRQNHPARTESVENALLQELKTLKKAKTELEAIIAFYQQFEGEKL